MVSTEGGWETGRTAARAAEEILQENPLLVAAAVFGAALVVVGLYLAYRFEWPMAVQFQRALREVDEVSVLMHSNPDPDAMASAIGLACLAEQEGIDATVQYPGQIRHQENRAFQTVLDLDLDRIDHVSGVASEAVLLVDHNEPRGFAGATDVLPWGVVDHHPGDGEGEVYTDVRTDYGACASIVVDYFRELDATPVPPDQHESEVSGKFVVPSAVATGLLYGILADTKHLTAGCTAADFAASAYLYPAVDEDLLDRIANPQVDAEVLDVKARAITDREVRGSFAVAPVGDITNADAVPQAADELLHLEGITAVVVWGRRNGTIHLSGRSRDDRVHMGRALELAFEDIHDANAGGHARMGGGQVPSSVEEPGLETRLFDAMTGDV